MDFFPFFRYPYYYNQNRYINPNIYNQRNINEKQKMHEKAYNQESKKENIIINENTENNRKMQETDEPAFEIFGIKLFFDDILIIALIFFLYNEGVKDNLLFISLILILLS